MVETVYVEGRRFNIKIGRGAGPWLNWHISRGRISRIPTNAEIRRLSWRRF